MKNNCVVWNFMDGIKWWWNGLGWMKERIESKRVSRCEAENLIDRMRGDGVMASWERWDSGRSSE